MEQSKTETIRVFEALLVISRFYAQLVSRKIITQNQKKKRERQLTNISEGGMNNEARESDTNSPQNPDK